MNSEPSYHRNIFIITGEVHSGKTTSLKAIVDVLKERKLTVSGFIAEGSFKDNRRDSFQLRDISSGNAIPLASIEGEDGWFRFRKFHFNPRAFEIGEKVIREARKDHPDVIIIDEVGPMELEGKGWHNVLKHLETDFKTTQIWVARESILREVLKRWLIPVENIFSAESMKFDELLLKIVPGISDTTN